MDRPPVLSVLFVYTFDRTTTIQGANQEIKVNLVDSCHHGMLVWCRESGR